MMFSSILKHNSQKLLFNQSPLLSFSSKFSELQISQERIRNLAVIAHVDHGKTTLVDQLLNQCNLSQQNTSMDVNPLEKSRGITILSKPTSLIQREHLINLIDTPGHADFAGEVERVLNIVDGVLILVCASEGPKGQTKQVARKAQSHGLKPVVLLNKVDRPGVVMDDAELAVMEMMEDVYPGGQQDVLYCSGKNNLAKRDMADQNSDLSVILDQIIDNFDKPKLLTLENDKKVKFQVTKTSSNEFFGKLGMGKICSQEGIKIGDSLYLHSATNKTSSNQKVTKMWKYFGTNQVEVDSAIGGDIVSVSGFDGVSVNDTITDTSNYELIDQPQIDDPLIVIQVNVNTSPLYGQEGTKFSAGDVEKYLIESASNDVSLKQDKGSNKVQGRGELHLGILFENMRREGYEFELSPPEIIMREEDGLVTEPFEMLHLEFDIEFQDKVIDFLFTRNGDLESQSRKGERSLMTFSIPTRGLFGFRSDFLSLTRGTGIATREFKGYQEHSGDILTEEGNALISTHAGVVTGYSIKNFQDKGPIQIAPGDVVQAGMVIGMSKGREIVVNPTKTYKLTNIRAAGKDEQFKLNAPVQFNIEEAITMVRPDEVIEVTPKSIRLRKRELNKKQRK